MHTYIHIYTSTICHVILKKIWIKQILGQLNSSFYRTEKQTFCLCYCSLVDFFPGQSLPFFPVASSDDC